jgi:hypothetical protein
LLLIELLSLFSSFFLAAGFANEFLGGSGSSSTGSGFDPGA